MAFTNIWIINNDLGAYPIHKNRYVSGRFKSKHILVTIMYCLIFPVACIAVHRGPVKESIKQNISINCENDVL